MCFLTQHNVQHNYDNGQYASCNLWTFRQDVHAHTEHSTWIICYCVHNKVSGKMYSTAIKSRSNNIRITKLLTSLHPENREQVKMSLWPQHDLQSFLFAKQTKMAFNQPGTVLFCTYNTANLPICKICNFLKFKKTVYFRVHLITTMDHIGPYNYYNGTHVTPSKRYRSNVSVI